ncbi:MAG: NAD-dependent epimerase/dehydratase family protein [Pseudonocardiaceae bacterium]
MSERVLITGAAGAIGTMLRPRIIRPERILRLLDIAPPPQAQPGERVETVEADITDLDAMRNAAEGVDAVIHLGGIAHESDWHRILHTNIHGTYTVLEAARSAGVPRVILASGNHAVGFHLYSDELIPDYLFPRPDTYYGVSKATNEARALGYQPQDDAERYANTLPPPSVSEADRYIGGSYFM